MIYFVTGKPRAGKSLYCMSLIWAELERGKRVVVTNLPLSLPDLNERCNASNVSIDLLSRIVILDGSKASKFWEWRVPRQEAAVTSTNPSEYSAWASDKPCFFVVDEVHLFFGARDWVKTGHEALWFMSQHAKLGDDIVLASQAVSLVEKQFRLLAQEFIYLENLSKQKAFGVRGPRRFMRSSYMQPVLGSPAPGQSPFEIRVFKGLDGSLERCYRTEDGVGVSGREADKGKRAEGLPVWVPILLLTLLALFVGWFCMSGTNYIGGQMDTQKRHPVKKSSVTPPPAAGPSAPASSAAGAALTTHAAPVDAKLAAGVSYRVTGLVCFGGSRVWCSTSDGRIYDTEKGAVIVLSPRQAVCDGTVYSR